MEVIDRVLANQEKKKLPKLANLTLHHQSGDQIALWKSFGFDLDPYPRMPVIEEGQTEEQIFNTILEIIRKVKYEHEDEYAGILVGGMSSCSIYSFYLADFVGLKVIRASTPRIRTESGHYKYELKGYSEILSESMLSILASKIIPDEELWEEEKTKRK